MNYSTRLITLTPNAEQTLLYCARVSNPANQDSNQTGLINYLIKHNHWSPFEMANMVVEIETSRAISAQILRHRSFTFQEFSQRYEKVQEFCSYPARRQDAQNRQNSIDDMVESQRDWFNFALASVQSKAQEFYDRAIDKGIAKEQARFLLPMSAKTKIYMNGTLRSWIHYIQLRTAVETQKEHRDIAVSIKEIFCNKFPITAQALGWEI